MNSVSPVVRTTSTADYDVLWSVPDNTLPGPLPTPDEIEDSKDVIKQGRARCISRVGFRYVVKFGTQVEKIEGDNMHWVREHVPEVPVPKVFAIYQREVTRRTKITYIVMEDVAAPSLDAVWGSLNIDQKKDVVIQIRQAFTHLRAANTLGYFGSVDMTKPRDDVFWTDEPIRDVETFNPEAAFTWPDEPIRDCETFNTEAAFTQDLINKYVTECGNSEPHKAEYYRRVLPTVLRGTDGPIFTHNDLRRKNIMVRDDGSIVIKGWATAGWYPSYWEYAKAMHACDFRDDWHQYVGKILGQEYPNQHAWMSKLRTEMLSQRFLR